jgi:poly(hydroxyalkanoate) depolymerase family esterase
MHPLSCRLRRSGAFALAPDPTAAPAALAPLHDFGSNPGDLLGWVHVPTKHAAHPALVVVLHGCTQTAASYDRGSGWSELADQHGFLVLYPEQQRSNNPNTCFSWFAPADASRDQGEALSIRQMIAAVAERHAVNPKRIFVTGLSAGGGMASVMLAAYPEVFAGGAIIAGLPFGTARNVPQAFERMRGQGGPSGAELGELVRGASQHSGAWPKVSVWQGSADTTVHPANADLIVEQWKMLHGVGRAETTTVAPGRVHTVWRGADGEVAVERFVISGLGHGTPISTSGAEHAGKAGPFMLEAGVSSTHEIARSWGLLDGSAKAARRDAAAAAKKAQAAISRELTASPDKAKPTLNRLIPEPEEAAPPPPQDNRSYPQRVIEEALRSAGLMR